MIHATPNSPQVDELAVTDTGDVRQNWRLSIVSDDTDVKDEVVVRIQGILTKNNLVLRNVQS